VRVANETRCCTFDVVTLKALLVRNPGMRQALEEGFNRNLVGKLERMNAANSARRSDAPPQPVAGGAATEEAGRASAGISGFRSRNGG
jgi:hypothetical protein